MSSTHNHCFSHHHYQAWCHQIFFVNNTKIFVTSSVLKLQKWFLHQNGVESNQESKSDMYKLLGGVWRCVSYQKMCSRWLLAWYCHLAWLDIVTNCAKWSYCSVGAQQRGGRGVTLGEGKWRKGQGWSGQQGRRCSAAQAAWPCVPSLPGQARAATERSWAQLVTSITSPSWH